MAVFFDKQAEVFDQAPFRLAGKLPDLVTEMLDKDLFAADSRDERKTDFLRKLLRHQLGVQGSVSSIFTRQLIDGDGNLVKDADGDILTEEKTINDVWFDRDMGDTILPDAPEIDPALLALGNMRGSGNVFDLGVAMSRDGQLAEMVKAFAARSETVSYQQSINAAADNILRQWSGTKEVAGINGYLLTSWGEYSVSNTTVAIVNAFAGSPFSMELMGKTIDYASGMLAISSLHERYDNIRADLIMSLLGTKMFGQAVCDSATGYIDHTRLENSIDAYMHGPSVTAEGKASMVILAVMLIKTSWLACDEAALADMGSTDPAAILSKLSGDEYYGQPDGSVNWFDSAAERSVFADCIAW